MTIRLRVIGASDEFFHDVHDHESVVVVGRHAQCDVVLDNEQRASRRHCQLERTEDGWVLVDLGSANGTMVAGERINRELLTPGDRFQIGRTVIYFGEPAPARRVPARRATTAPSPARRAAPPARRDAASSRRRHDAPVVHRDDHDDRDRYGDRPRSDRRASLTELREEQKQLRTVRNLVITVCAVAAIALGGVMAYRAFAPSGTNGDDTGHAGDDSPVPVDEAVRRRALNSFDAIANAADPPEARLAKLRELVSRNAHSGMQPELQAKLEQWTDRLGRMLTDDLEEVIRGTYRMRREHRYGHAMHALQAFAQAYEEDVFRPTVWLPRYSDEINLVRWEARRFFDHRLMPDVEQLAIDRNDAPAAIRLLQAAKPEHFHYYDEMAGLCDHWIAVVQSLSDSEEGHEAAQQIRDNTRERLTDEELAPGHGLPPQVDHPDTPGDGPGPAPVGVGELFSTSEAAEMLAIAQDRLIEACNIPGELVTGRIELGGQSCAVIGADDDSLSFMFEGRRASTSWKQIDGETRVALYLDIKGKDEKELWGTALYAARAGLIDEAEGVLYLLHEDHPAERSRVIAYLCEWRRTDVPDGGFVPWRPAGASLGGFVTRAEADQAALDEQVSVLLDDLDDALDAPGERGAERQAAVATALRELGPSARRKAVALILERKAEAAERISKMAFGENSALRRLKQELDAARAEALEFIYDEQLFVHETHEGLDEVYRLVGRVEEIWTNPSAVVDVPPQVTRIVERVQSLLALAREIDPDGAAAIDDEEAGLMQFVSDHANRQLSIQTFSEDPGEREMYRMYPIIERDNNEGESDATPEEREHLSVLNAYRVMMGRWPLRINSKLVRSARSHSGYMQRTGQFAHEIPGHPDGRTPADRAANQGFNGGGAENIARGSVALSPQRAFDLWFESPGHHRNMLRDSHRVAGIGSVGTHWTQQFDARPDGSEPEVS